VLRNLLTGLPVMFLCLLLQASFVTTLLHYYSGLGLAEKARGSQLRQILLLSMVMLLMLLSNLAQMAIWAVLFYLLGEFADISTALYHSAVNFVTLGYGDIVMTERWRLLGPLEAVNGILMFGVSTAVMTAAVLDVVKQRTAPPRRRERTNE
jgi:ion channel